MKLTIGDYLIRINFSSKQPWHHIKLHKYSGMKHLVAWKLSAIVEDLSTEVALCKLCHSDEIGEVFSGDEGITVCQHCGAIEQGYEYVSKRTCNKMLRG